MVLDFDDTDTFRAFSAAYPRLTDTKTVQTRRGYHLYFQVPSYLRLSSCHTPGVDLQWDGRYIVAPPSDGYTLLKGRVPKTLSQHDVEAINDFISAQQSRTAEAQHRAKPTNRHSERPQQAAARAAARSDGIHNHVRPGEPP